MNSSFSVFGWIFFWMVALLIATPLQAEPRLELDEVLVTATGRQDMLSASSKSMVVITAEDIRQAPSNDLIDLLAREANITVRSFTGNDKKASIDIRGMGDTSTSNVVVFVDGVRLNASDLSGSDLSTIPLSQIQRIEIIRGAASVRYGNGAVGGVVNIITEPLQDQNQANAYFSSGSYASRDLRLSLQQAFSRGSLDFNYADYDSEGYRDNGQLKKRNAKLGGRFYANDWLMLRASASVQEDEYGLPGPVSEENYRGNEAQRKSTVSPNDGGSTNDQRYLLGTEMDISDRHYFEVISSYRDRKNPYVIGFTPLLSYERQQSRIDEQSTGLDVLYRLSLPDYRFSFGLNLYEADYLSQRNGTDLLGQSTKRNGDISDYAAYFLADISLATNTTLNLGYREGRYRIKQNDQEYVQVCDFFDFMGTPIAINCRNVWNATGQQDDKWRNNAAELGLVYQHKKSLSLYFNASQSFRNPNIDELALATADLRPQKGINFDAGLRYRISRKFESTVNIFMMRIDDEILFGLDQNGQQTNHNAEETTRRTGLEIELKYYPFAQWYLWSSLGYVEARFEESGTTIPLVPKTTLSGGVEWRPLKSLSVSLVGHYVGQRFDGNDETNTAYAPVASYQTFDSKIIYRLAEVELFAGVNNMGDEIYATSVYSNSYYPMPGRHYQAGVSLNL